MRAGCQRERSGWARLGTGSGGWEPLSISHGAHTGGFRTGFSWLWLGLGVMQHGNAAGREGSLEFRSRGRPLRKHLAGGTPRGRGLAVVLGL